MVVLKYPFLCTKHFHSTSMIGSWQCWWHVFLVIDVLMLVIFSAIEGTRGGLVAERVLDPETPAIEQGVRVCIV